MYSIEKRVPKIDKTEMIMLKTKYIFIALKPSARSLLFLLCNPRLIKVDDRNKK